MSAALNKAITARLRGTEVLTGEALEAQTRLVALISTRTRLGNFSQSVAFPQVCFRPSGGVTSWISRSEELGVVAQPEYDFEAWTNVRDGEDIPTILDLIEQILDDRRSVAAPLTLDSGYHCVAMHLIMDASFLYVPTINAWAGFVRYQAIEQRYKQGS